MTNPSEKKTTQAFSLSSDAKRIIARLEADRDVLAAGKLSKKKKKKIKKINSAIKTICVSFDGAASRVTGKELVKRAAANPNKPPLLPLPKRPRSVSQSLSDAPTTMVLDKERKTMRPAKRVEAPLTQDQLIDKIYDAFQKVHPLQPTRDTSKTRDYAWEKDRGEQPAKRGDSPVPSPLFVPSSKTKRTVVFLVDGSGSATRTEADGTSLLNRTLGAIQETERSLLRHDTTNPAYEIVLFGDWTPAVIDRTSTRHPGLNSGSFVLPTLAALATTVAAHPNHMFHVVVLGDGDLSDQEPDLAPALAQLMVASPRITVDFVETSSYRPGETAMAKLATRFASKSNVGLTTVTRADDAAIMSNLIQQAVAKRLYAPLPPVTKKPAKKPPAV